MKPSVILDVAFLGHEGAIRRGTERVSQQLFLGLLSSDFYNLSLVATSHLAGAYDFLKAQGLDPLQLLYFSPTVLRRSRLARSLSRRVHHSLKDRSLSARAVRYLLARMAILCGGRESDLAPEWLSRAQIYHSPHTPYPAAVRACRHLRRFITCHDFIPLKHPEYSSPGTRQFMESVLECLQPDNFAFCVSETTRNDLLRYSKMPPERVFVTPLAADPHTFQPVTDANRLAEVTKRYGLGDDPYFLALSAHDPHKNFAHLVECFGRLLEAGDLRECNLVIVGSNPDRRSAVQAAAARFPGLTERVIEAGFVPDEDLAAIYSGSIAFLFPSIAEGFGIPPLEAMQCGVPVIGSNTTSIPEVVGDAGLLLPPTDKDAWCATMLRIARDTQLRVELSNRSIARARHFSWKRFIDQTLAGYRASLEHF